MIQSETQDTIFNFALDYMGEDLGINKDTFLKNTISESLTDSGLNQFLEIDNLYDLILGEGFSVENLFKDGQIGDRILDTGKQVAEFIIPQGQKLLGLVIPGIGPTKDAGRINGEKPPVGPSLLDNLFPAGFNPLDTVTGGMDSLVDSALSAGAMRDFAASKGIPLPTNFNADMVTSKLEKIGIPKDSLTDVESFGKFLYEGTKGINPGSVIKTPPFMKSVAGSFPKPSLGFLF